MANAPFGTLAEVVPLMVLEPVTLTVTSPEALGTKISVKKLLPSGVGRVIVVLLALVTYSSEALSPAPSVTGEDACVTTGIPILQFTITKEPFSQRIWPATALVIVAATGLVPPPTMLIP